ncbi:hypothetical protein Y032_0132g1718 [Ancylostoma ceylanicum]|uniref:Uncharacterized protein n=1 Tax=Ancylostoma ceylanicum TaxID=53326 RepID=A0A016T6Q5_9BILA|nr:hypothetical protein Y032_0132g1718 [Ancylostoma ceylanicum]
MYWLPATAATSGEHFLPVCSVRSSVIYVFVREFAPADWYAPRHGKQVKRPFWDISSKRCNQHIEEVRNMLIAQTRIRGGPRL